VKAVISIIFGERENSIGWIAEEDLPELPLIGMPVIIQIDEASPAFEGQVYRAWESDEEEQTNGGMLIYGGADLPDHEFMEKFELAGWELLGEDALQVLSAAIEHTPALAATHEVLLLVGERGQETKFAAFQRQIIPYDPALPLFGQRMRLEISSVRKIFEFESKEQWQEHREIEVVEVESELALPQSIDGINNGLPAIVIFSSLIRNGVGKVVFWCPNFGNLHPEHLLAHGWETVSSFEAGEFKTEERIELALDTKLNFVMNDYGTAEMDDWQIQNPLNVPETSYELLPKLLLEYVKASKEFENIDSILQEWAKDKDD
jgi:hypothetical protein